MFAQAARGPVLLIVLGTLFALQQAGMLAIARSWPLLIIVIGVMKLIERMAGGVQRVYPVPPAGGPYPGYTRPGYRGSGAPPPGGAGL